MSDLDFPAMLQKSYEYATHNELKMKMPTPESNAVLRAELPRGNRQPGDSDRQRRMDSQGNDAQYISDVVPRRED